MYELNNILKEMFGKDTLLPAQKREILAMSVIEYARRIQTTLGLWTSMNIEIIVNNRGLLDYYTLPYEIILLISDRKIAAALSEIGEYFVLNAILDGRFEEILEMAYDLLKVNLKKDRNKADTQFINGVLRNTKKIQFITNCSKIFGYLRTNKR
jgi:CRISPR-associated protein Cst1